VQALDVGLGVIEELFNPSSSLSSPVPAPSSRSGHISAFIDGELLVFGGENTTGVVGDLWGFSVEGRRWRSIDTPMGSPSGRSGHASATVGRTVFVHGGGDRTRLRDKEVSVYGDLWVYDTTTSDWVEISVPEGQPDPGRRYGHSLTLAGGKLYLFGGANSSAQRLMDLWAFSLEDFSWEKINTGQSIVPRGRLDHTAVAVGEVMLFYGGRGAKPLGDVWEFHCESKQWRKWANASSSSLVRGEEREEKPRPAPRFAHTAHLVLGGSRLLVLGGTSAEHAVIPPYGSLWLLVMPGHTPSPNSKDDAASSTAFSVSALSDQPPPPPHQHQQQQQHYYLGGSAPAGEFDPEALPAPAGVSSMTPTKWAALHGDGDQDETLASHITTYPTPYVREKGRFRGTPRSLGARDPAGMMRSSWVGIAGGGDPPLRSAFDISTDDEHQLMMAAASGTPGSPGSLARSPHSPPPTVTAVPYHPPPAAQNSLSPSAHNVMINLQRRVDSLSSALAGLAHRVNGFDFEARMADSDAIFAASLERLSRGLKEEIGEVAGGVDAARAHAGDMVGQVGRKLARVEEAVEAQALELEELHAEHKATVRALEERVTRRLEDLAREARGSPVRTGARVAEIEAEMASLREAVERVSEDSMILRGAVEGSREAAARRDQEHVQAREDLGARVLAECVTAAAAAVVPLEESVRALMRDVGATRFALGDLQARLGADAKERESRGAERMRSLLVEATEALERRAAEAAEALVARGVDRASSAAAALVQGRAEDLQRETQGKLDDLLEQTMAVVNVAAVEAATARKEVARVQREAQSAAKLAVAAAAQELRAEYEAQAAGVRAEGERVRVQLEERVAERQGILESQVRALRETLASTGVKVSAIVANFDAYTEHLSEKVLLAQSRVSEGVDALRGEVKASVTAMEGRLAELTGAQVEALAAAQAVETRDLHGRMNTVEEFSEMSHHQAMHAIHLVEDRAQRDAAEERARFRALETALHSASAERAAALAAEEARLRSLSETVMASLRIVAEHIPAVGRRLAKELADGGDAAAEAARAKLEAARAAAKRREAREAEDARLEQERLELVAVRFQERRARVAEQVRRLEELNAQRERMIDALRSEHEQDRVSASHRLRESQRTIAIGLARLKAVVEAPVFPADLPAAERALLAAIRSHEDGAAADDEEVTTKVDRKVARPVAGSGSPSEKRLSLGSAAPSPSPADPAWRAQSRRSLAPELLMASSGGQQQQAAAMGVVPMYHHHHPQQQQHQQQQQQQHHLFPSPAPHLSPFVNKARPTF
jgi:hypothetical protein